MVESQHIILNSLSKPRERANISWLCESFGFETELTNQIMRELTRLLYNEKRTKGGISSEELANRLDINTARLNHHIRNFVSSGLLEREKKRIVIRGGNMQEMVSEVRKDAERILDGIEEIAIAIDEKFHLSRIK